MTESRCRFHKGLQHCPQIETRPADDFKDVGGSSLLLQGNLSFFKQPHILDRYHRLISKGFEKLNTQLPILNIH
jgi:hypothetical protein